MNFFDVHFKRITLITIILLGFFSCGCVELGHQTRGGGTALAGTEIVEHTYLWGDNGPFTKIYDIRVWGLGVDVINLKGITQSELNSITSRLNSLNQNIPNQNMPITTRITTRSTPGTIRTKSVAFSVEKYEIKL